MESMSTKGNFITAFWKLYEDKKIEKISIRELCEVAGYNRTTFYDHFHDIYDLVDNAIIILVSPILNNVKSLENLDSLLDFNFIENIFLAFFDKNNKYIQLILKNDPHILEYKAKEIIIPLAKKKILSKHDDDVLLDCVIQYQISAVWGLLRFWHEDGCSRISREDLSRVIFEISTKGVFSLVNESFINSRLLIDDES